MSVFRKNIKRVNPEISTASLPDVVFILLFFFMVSAVFRTTQQTVKVNLPSAKNSNNDRINNQLSIIVSTKNDSSVCYFGKLSGSPEDLKSWLISEKEQLQPIEIEKLKIIIRADAQTPVGFINRIKKSLQETDLLQVRFFTNHP